MSNNLKYPPQKPTDGKLPAASGVVAVEGELPAASSIPPASAL
jgi:hypothetical protein